MGLDWEKKAGRVVPEWFYDYASVDAEWGSETWWAWAVSDDSMLP